jgi:preprotein translocase subunit SecE
VSSTLCLTSNAYKYCRLFNWLTLARGKTTVARQETSTTTQQEDSESIVRVFFRGFFWPLKMLGRGLAWLAHKPPLQQIGHGLRWFFRLRGIQLIGRGLGFGFFRGSFQELQQVTWPTRREGRRLTTAVIIFSVVFGLLIAVVDYGLDKLFKQVLLK